jgi:U4/U6.U5 tri-snRNP component SNU23
VAQGTTSHPCLNPISLVAEWSTIFKLDRLFNPQRHEQEMSDSKKRSTRDTPADEDSRKNYNLDEYAAKAKEREAREREEAKARYEAKLAGKKYYKPLTGDESFASARRTVLDLSAQVGKTQLVPAGAGVGKRGRGAGFYCEACDLTFKDNKQFVEHLNTPQHLANTGQKTEVKRATVEEVHTRIEMHWQRKLDLEAERATSLHERLELREKEREKELEERRQKRKEDQERRREEKEKAAKVKTEYGDDVRIEGEHDEEDILAQMGITGFGTSKK